MISKAPRLFLIIFMLTYGQKGKANVENDQKILKKVNKLEVKVNLLENEIETRDRMLKNIFAEQIAELKTKTFINFTENPMVAFSAHTPTAESYEEGDTYVFGNVILNKGNGYDRSNGKFTAPESGLYQFFLHVCNESGKNAATAIVHDHTYIAYSVQISRYSSCSTVTALRMVEKGQKVFVKCTYTTMLHKATNQYRRSSFSGVMLHVK